MVDIDANLSADRLHDGENGGHEALQQKLVVYSDQLELLLDHLAESISALQRSSPLGRIDIVVPHQNMEAWCKLGLAERLGITANIEFMRARRFVRRLAASIQPDSEGRRVQIADEALFREHLLYLFFEDRHALKDSAVPREVEEYIGESMEREEAVARRIQLASRLASLFTLYDESTDFLIQWQEDRNVGFADASARKAENWQRAIWKTIRGRMDMQSEKIVLLGQLGKPEVSGELVLPHAAFFFGISHMPLSYLKIADALAVLPRRPPFQVFAFNPSSEYWSEIGNVRRIHRNFAVPGSAGSEGDENDLLSGGREEADHWKSLAGNPLLMAMGRPGREYVRALNELSNFDFEDAFPADASDAGAAAQDQADGGPVLLRQLQGDVRNNAVEIHPLHFSEDSKFRGCGSDTAGNSRETSVPADNSIPECADFIRIFSCPGIQRECEEAVRCTSDLLQRDSSLRFGDISILVAGRTSQNSYFNRLKGAFANEGIPVCCSEFRGNSASRVAEAASRLVRLPIAGFSRGSVMNVLCHPCVLANTPSISTRALASLVDSLGIFYGLDSRDQHQSGAVYLDEAHDVFNWDQGVTRIALGLSMCGTDFGDRTPFVRSAFRPKNGPGDSRPDSDPGENFSPDVCRNRLSVGASGQAEQSPSDSSPQEQFLYWPAQIPSEMRSEASRWLLMVQSLLADARFAAEARGAQKDAWLTMEEWAVFIAEFVGAYVFAQESEEREKAEIVRAARELRHHSLRNFDNGNEIRVPYDVAASLYLESLNKRRAVEGNYLLDGVSISSLSSVLPARHLIVVGLSAGNFPTQTNRSQIDLTREKISRDSGGSLDFRRFLVTESEAERYLFLQTVMSARESLSLFFTGRDQTNGCPLNPAPPLADLENLLLSYMPDRVSFRKAVTPCRCDLQNFASLRKIISGERHDEKAAESERNSCPGASREAAALALREILRLRNPSCVKSAVAAGSFLDCRGLSSLPQDSKLRKHLSPIFRKLNFLEDFFSAPGGNTKESDCASREFRSVAETGAYPSKSAAQRQCSGEENLPVFRVTLRQLCQFLKEPALGSAETLLGLRHEDEDETEDAKKSCQDEMFSNSSLIKSIALGDSIARWFAAGAPDSFSDDAELHSDLLYYQSQGSFPAASFGETAEREQLREIDEIQKELKKAIPEIGAAGSTVARFRFRERYSNGMEVSAEPPDFSSCGPLTVSGRKFILSLQGRTEFIRRNLDSTGGQDTFAVISLKKDGNDALIHSFLSAMTCLAAGIISGDPSQKIPFRCVVRDKNDKKKFRTLLSCGVSGEEAKAYLFCLAAKMLSSPNSYRMSGSVVLKKFSESQDVCSKDFSDSHGNTWRGALDLSEIERLPLPSDAEMTAAFDGSSPAFRWGFLRNRLDVSAQKKNSKRKS